MQETYHDAYLDEHIPSLVCLPPGTSGVADFAKQHQIVPDIHHDDRSDERLKVSQRGVSAFIIQDKASCMPGQVLFEEFRRMSRKNKGNEKTDFIDACAGHWYSHAWAHHLLNDFSRDFMYS